MIIDAHVHCGILDQFPPQDIDDYLAYSTGSGIKGAVMFSPVAEIYDRYDFNFQDNVEWQEKRKKSNEYLLNIGDDNFTVYPYFFIWNDFAVDQLTPKHKGIKWHRHSYEPIYHYDDELCNQAIETIKDRKMPVVYEEELFNTINFIKNFAKGVRVIIPHLGGLNGGYDAIKKNGLWELPNVYADTALASLYEIKDYIENYGYERIFFGSDFPFGNPNRELEKVLKLKISDDLKEQIISQNIIHLLKESNIQ